jgi:formylmethanofuran dehydrogenase subunit E-like metal-binding protein
VVKIAMDNDIPLINLWLALESLPNHGLEMDGFHLDEPPDARSCYLVGDYLQNGYPVRNLVTLQTLDAVWRGAMQ